MHASLRTSGKSGGGGLLHFHLEVTRVSIIEGFFFGASLGGLQRELALLLTNAHRGDCAVGFPRLRRCTRFPSGDGGGEEVAVVISPRLHLQT